MVRERLDTYLTRRRRGMWVAAVTSGKGGVGKTCVAVNLSVAMARLGVAPVLVDADLGLANAHLLLGVMPKRTLDDLVRGAAGMEEILVHTGYGVTLVPGGSGVKELADLDRPARENLAREVHKLYRHAEALVIDTGSGISDSVLRFLRLADDIIVVVTPNVASCLDALGVIRAAEESGCAGRVNVLVNRCRDEVQAREVYLRLYGALRGISDRPLWYLGHLPEDAHLEQSFSAGKPVTSLASACRVSRQIRHLARSILSDRSERAGASDDRIVEVFSGLARSATA